MTTPLCHTPHDRLLVAGMTLHVVQSQPHGPPLPTYDPRKPTPLVSSKLSPVEFDGWVRRRQLRKWGRVAWDAAIAVVRVRCKDRSLITMQHASVKQIDWYPISREDARGRWLRIRLLIDVWTPVYLEVV